MSEGGKIVAFAAMGAADPTVSKVVPYAVMGVTGAIHLPKFVVYTVLGSDVDLTGVILRTDDGIWRVTEVTESNSKMTLELWEEPKRIVHETGDDF